MFNLVFLFEVLIVFGFFIRPVAESFVAILLWYTVLILIYYILFLALFESLLHPPKLICMLIIKQALMKSIVEF